MRYYDIQLAGGVGSFGSGWKSHSGNVADPGAQEVIMNLEVYNATNDGQNGMAASDQSTIEIKGVSWQQIKDSNKLVQTPIKIYGGIKPGFELAAAQSVNAGELCTGTIFRTWGNWVGTEMSLGMSFIASSPSASNAVGSQGQFGSETTGNGAAPAAPAAPATTAEAQAFRVNRTGLRSIDRRNFAKGRQPIINPLDGGGDFGLGTLVGGLSSGTSSFGGIFSSLIGGGFPGLTQPLNLIHNLQENMPLASAIQQTLSTAFPNLKMNINISPKLKLNYQDAGVYQNMEQYAAYILNLSRSILGAKNYLGVHIGVHNDTAYIWDGSGASGPTDIRGIDLIGQPTWIEYNKIEIKVVMRANLILGQIVTIPKGTLINTGPGAVLGGSPASEQMVRVTMEGLPVRITKITHIGDFRNPDGNYWCTVIVGLAPNPPEVPIPNISNVVGSQGQFGVLPSKKNVTIILPPGVSVSPNTQFGSVFKRGVRMH